MEKPALIVLLTLLAIPLHAADVSDLSYDASGDTVIITDYVAGASSALIIPARIEGKLVSASIGDWAFVSCTSLTGITFRGNAPTLGDDVFLEVNANAKVFIYEGASGFSPEGGKFGGFPVVVQKKPVPPKIISVVVAGGVAPISPLTITFTSGIGSNYAIERSRDLVNWVTLLIIAGEESSTEFTDNEPINDGGGVFYRIREGQ